MVVGVLCSSRELGIGLVLCYARDYMVLGGWRLFRLERRLFASGIVCILDLVGILLIHIVR